MKSKLSMILFVLILGSVLTTALVSVDAFTKEPIARNKAMKLKKSVLASLGVAYTKDNIEQMFSESVETKEYDQSKISLGILYLGMPTASIPPATGKDSKITTSYPSRAR